MLSSTIALAGDHAGFDYKEALKAILIEKGYSVKDFGPNARDSVDYPDYIHPMAQAMEEGDFKLGIIVCGSGNGVAITANKYPHIRAALCWLPELASLARQHNDANVLALPARFIELEAAKNILDSFLSANFEGGRHARRVAKIADGLNF